MVLLAAQYFKIRKKKQNIVLYSELYAVLIRYGKYVRCMIMTVVLFAIQLYGRPIFVTACFVKINMPQKLSACIKLKFSNVVMHIVRPGNASPVFTNVVLVVAVVVVFVVISISIP